MKFKNQCHGQRKTEAHGKNRIGNKSPLCFSIFRDFADLLNWALLNLEIFISPHPKCFKNVTFTVFSKSIIKYTVKASFKTHFVASELECLPVEGTPRLQRAMSCDSISSDSSVLEIEPDVPKIGQLEFGVEYDRYLFLFNRFEKKN